VKNKKTIEIPIPAGIDNGQSIRIRGKGEPGTNGGARGDLLVNVTVDRHPVFQRSDYDIYSTVPISFAEAALGGDIKKNTICCFSATKTFNLAGLQACNIVFHNDEWKARFDKFWTGLDIHRNNCFSLCAMEAAWREGDEWLEQLIEYIEGNYMFVKEWLEENLPQVKMNLPEATYLGWLDFTSLGMSGEELGKFMVEKAGVGMNNGKDFCRSLDGFMRMNMAIPRATIKKALEQIKKAVDNI